VESTFITEIIKAGVCPVQVANMVNCKYDAKSNTLTTESEDKLDKARSSMANAKWFKHSFDISALSKKDKKKTAPPPELMFNIDGTRSIKTIHEKKVANTSEPGHKVSPLALDVSSNSSSSNSSRSASSSSSNASDVMSLSLGSLKTPSCNDEDSTSLSIKERSHSQVSVGNVMSDEPASSVEVNGSAQGATLSG
jgi:hypothetical protein